MPRHSSRTRDHCLAPDRVDAPTIGGRYRALFEDLPALDVDERALSATIAPTGDVPFVYACYRFTAKLRIYGDMLTGCIDRVTASLSAQLPEYGRNVAIDGSDMPAYTPWSRARLPAGPRCTVAAPLSSASSDASRTSGR